METQTSSTPIVKTATSSDEHPLVTRIKKTELAKIDGIAAALGINRSEATRQLLNIAFLALAAKIPEVLEGIDIELENTKRLREAQAHINNQFKSGR